MFKRLKLKCGEVNNGVPHPEFQVRNTRVSEYLIKYGQGKINELPTDNRPTIKDDRSDDEKLKSSDEYRMDRDELDTVSQLNEMSDRIAEIESEIDENSKDFEKFSKAKEVLENPNSSDDAKADAYRILNELVNKGKVSRS